jgi:hypothetical protein
MSPSIVTAPDERRASMRSCIGVRSCASSTIRWPRAASGPSRSARASSSSAGPPRSSPGRADRRRALLVLVEDAVRSGCELLRARQQAPDELLGPRTRPQRAERAIEEAAASAGSLRCRRTSGPRPLPRRAVALVEARTASCAGAPARPAWSGRFGLRSLDQPGDLLRREPAAPLPPAGSPSKSSGGRDW